MKSLLFAGVLTVSAAFAPAALADLPGVPGPATVTSAVTAPSVPDPTAAVNTVTGSASGAVEGATAAVAKVGASATATGHGITINVHIGHKLTMKSFIHALQAGSKIHWKVQHGKHVTRLLASFTCSSGSTTVSCIDTDFAGALDNGCAPLPEPVAVEGTLHTVMSFTQVGTGFHIHIDDNFQLNSAVGAVSLLPYQAQDNTHTEDKDVPPSFDTISTEDYRINPNTSNSTLPVLPTQFIMRTTTEISTGPPFFSVTITTHCPPGPPTTVTAP